MQRSRWLITVIAVGIVPLVYAQGQGNGNGNPFIDHADTGETVHVLPAPAAVHSPRDTQPTEAPVTGQTSAYPASYGSGNLTYHGGFVMSSAPGAKFKAIYWNSSVANSTATSLGYATIKDQINDFVNAFPNNADWSGAATDDYSIVQQYSVSSPSISRSLTNLGSTVDSQPTKAKIQDSAIRSYLAGLFTAGTVAADSNTLYGVYFPAGMRVQLTGGSSCTSFCGYHSHFSYGTIQIKYAVFPYPNCFGCSLAGKSVADMLTIVSSHEIREAVTDPGDNGVNAWYDAAGYEADDKCAWHNLYTMANGGFWVQPEYSNGGNRPTASGGTAAYPGPGCIVPK